MYTRWVCFLAFAFLCITIPINVSAQQTRTIFGQDEGRILLFVDHENNRVNVILEPIFGTYDPYNFEPFDIQWIIPLPAPTSENTDSLFDLPGSYPRLQDELDQVDFLTQVHFEPEVPRYCYDTFEYMGRSGDASYPVELAAQTTDYAVIPDSDPSTVLNQLHEKGYDIANDDVSRLQQYAEIGSSFLAVKYHFDYDEDPGANQYTIYGAPIAFSFEWSDETIPLTFTSSIFGNPTTWIFSDQGYRPTNSAIKAPDYHQFHVPHSIVNTGSFTYYDHAENDFSILTDEQYHEEIQRILNGGGLAIEYAGSTGILATLDNGILAQIIKDYPYVSRFIMQTSETISYPIYEPAQDQPDISNIIDLNMYVDPLTYWGCGSRTALNESTRANLPDAHYRVDDLRFAVAYPSEWQFSTLTTEDGTIYGLSPEPLTLDAVLEALEGTSDQPPMFIFTEYMYITDGFAGPLLTEKDLFTQLNIEKRVYPGMRNFSIRFDMHQKESQQEHGVMYGIIAEETDWTKNEAMYKAMLAYAQSYQYFASAEWPNTLLIQSHPQAEPIINLEIPYPDGWIEYIDGDNIIISDEVAEMRLIPAATITPDLLQQRYNLTDDLICEQPTRFLVDGREGYVLSTTGYVAEVSAPEGKIAEYKSSLLKMMDVLPSICS